MLTLFFRFVSTGLLIVLLGLNVLTLTSQAVFDSLSSAVGRLGSMVGYTEFMQDSPFKKQSSQHSELNKLRKNRDGLNAQISVLNDDLKKKNKKIVELTADKESLLSEKNSITQQKAALEDELEIKRAKVRSLTKQISARTARNVGINVSSAVGEAIPYVGVGLVAATVAMDVYDGCQTMKDMDELATVFGEQSKELTAQKAEVCGQTVNLPTAESLESSILAAGDTVRGTYESAASNVNEWRSETGETMVNVSVIAWEQAREKARKFEDAVGGTIAIIIENVKKVPLPDIPEIPWSDPLDAPRNKLTDYMCKLSGNC